jgi:hypothetical protein
MQKLAYLLLLCSVVLAQDRPQRVVKRRTIFSKELPAAEFTVGKGFSYLGGQVVNLYGNADAEQHLFVHVKDGLVTRFCWLQFEHFLPTNKMTYDYPSERAAKIGDLDFLYDVRGYAKYATLNAEDLGSDGAAVSRLLAKKQLVLPQRAARLRLIHLPTTARRTELMIIYGEALDLNISGDRVALDDAYPEVAKRVLDHARESLTIRAH